MFLLFVIFTHSWNKAALSVTTSQFANEATCLQAISKLIDLEKDGIKIKATCVRNQ